MAKRLKLPAALEMLEKRYGRTLATPLTRSETNAPAADDK